MLCRIERRKGAACNGEAKGMERVLKSCAYRACPDRRLQQALAWTGS